jgi:hypothetical protein
VEELTQDRWSDTDCRTLHARHGAPEGADHQILSRFRGFEVTIGQAYDTLGLDASSTTPDEARLRFRDLIHLNHPDGKPSHEQALPNETTRVIFEACTLLRTKGFPRLMARKPNNVTSRHLTALSARARGGSFFAPLHCS